MLQKNWRIKKTIFTKQIESNADVICDISQQTAFN